MRQLYEAIAARLLKHFSDVVLVKKFGKITYVDRYYNQFRNMAQMSPIRLPGFGIALNVPTWQSNGRNIQDGTVTVEIHMASQILGSSEITSKTKGQALLTWDLMCEVHIALQGFDGDFFTSLNRINSIADEEFTNVIEDVVTYQTVIRDTTADDKKNFAQKQVDEVEVVNDQDLVQISETPNPNFIVPPIP